MVTAEPEFLFVQVGTIDDPRLGFQIMDHLSSSDETESAEGKLPNLAGVTSGGFLGLQNWGYTVGQLAGRSPIVLPTAERKSWEISAEAQRSKQHSYFIAFTAILIGFVVLGLRRGQGLFGHQFQKREPTIGQAVRLQWRLRSRRD